MWVIHPTIFLWTGLKAGDWLSKQLCWMHWQCRSGKLALAAAGNSVGGTCLDIGSDCPPGASVRLMIAMTQTATHRFVCVACEIRGTFTTAYPTARATKIHIAKSPACKLADLGMREIVLETRQTDAMVGGSGAAGPAPELRHQPPGLARPCKKKVGVGIY